MESRLTDETIKDLILILIATESMGASNTLGEMVNIFIGLILITH